MVSDRKRPIISLLTDFGDGSYVPSVKGVLLRLVPETTIVDIAHNVPPCEAGPAAYLIRHTFPFFPAGTIHMTIVDPGVGTDRLGLIVRASGSSFVGPDNGVFGEILRAFEDARAWQIESGPWMPERIAPTFHGRDLFAYVAAGLARGDDPSRFGSPLEIDALVPTPIAPPRVSTRRLSGEVVWVDRFGNLITNIGRTDIEAWAGDEPYRALVGGMWIDTRVHTFLEASRGSLVVLFGSWETLEVVVAAGNASDRLGVSMGEPVHLERIHDR